MVLESLMKPFVAVKRPWELFFYGVLVASVGLFLSHWIFRDRADLVMIFLTVLACVPLMFHAIRNEEKADLQTDGEVNLLKRHARVIEFYTFLFVGICVGYVLWFVVLPGSMTNSLFKQQVTTIAQINAASVKGFAVHLSTFNKIFFNNIKVLIFCILFSFFYGAGAIFILVWNASVVSAAIGNLIKSSWLQYAAAGGVIKVAAGAQSVFYSFGRYFIHGLPEMAGYMVAGLAGGIISVAVIRKDFGTDRFEKIMFDTAMLLVIAIGFVLIAALIETFVTPVLF